MEYLDIVDDNGIPTGMVVSRTKAHEKGVLHRTSHVWILRRRGAVIQVLLQKRCQMKDSHPGCYDISSAEHIPAGSEFISSALRELKEELGLSARADELVFCGRRRFYYQKEFHGKLFKDNQISNVYVLWRDIAAEKILFQKSEIESVKWFDFEVFEDLIINNKIPHCIAAEEIQILKKAVL